MIDNPSTLKDYLIITFLYLALGLVTSVPVTILYTLIRLIGEQQ